MSTEFDNNALVNAYTDRFGEPFTVDEVYGYWLFAASVVLAVAGMLLFLATGSAGTIRQVAFVLAGLGLAGALAGLVVGQSFDRRAKRLVYLGGVVCVLAVLWFVSVYPGNWRLGGSTTTSVILVYVVGMAIIGLSGVLAPVAVGQSRAREALEEELLAARREAAEAGGDAEAARAETEQARGAAAGERERAEQAEAALERAQDSNATFQLYRDRSSEWRWRLVHRNRNIIATSGESYSSDRTARRGMRSVKRNATGAEVIWEREEEPEPTPAVRREDSRATFERYRDEDGKHRWRLRHDNGEILAASTRGFSGSTAADESVERVRSYVGPADYLEFDPAAFQVYEDAGGEFRWRLVHRNGRILADSGEGYASRGNARRAVGTVAETAGDAEVDEDSGSGPRFEVFEDSAGEHRWRLVSANGETIADSAEGYSRRSNAVEAAERVRERAGDADTLTVGEAAIEIYEDSAGEHRWRLRHRNGRILATGGEGYASRSGAIEGVNSVKRNAPEAAVERLE